jgi:hypothetical protein
MTVAPHRRKILNPDLAATRQTETVLHRGAIRGHLRVVQALGMPGCRGGKGGRLQKCTEVGRISSKS